MANPTLVYSSTTVNLPYPREGMAARSLVESRSSKRTLAGNLRTGVLYWTYAYSMKFEGVARTVWEDVVSLWDSAVTAGAYPTFSATDVWTTANGVQVSLEVGDCEVVAADPTKVAFSLVCEEVAPR